MHVSHARGTHTAEVVLPEQFLTPRRGAHQPLRLLMSALLEEAIVTFRRQLDATDGRGQRLFREAETWLMGGDVGAAVRLEDACDVLDLDADFLRSTLRRWRDAELASLATEGRRALGPRRARGVA
jgi:hypothetical protein